MGEQIKLQIEVGRDGATKCVFAICANALPTTLLEGVDKQESESKEALVTKADQTDLANSDLPAGGQEVVHVPAALGCRQFWLGEKCRLAIMLLLSATTHHSWRWNMDGADRSGGAVVGDMAEHHSVREGRSQVLSKRHLRQKVLQELPCVPQLLPTFSLDSIWCLR